MKVKETKLCELQELWATGKGSLCEILQAMYCGQRKAERQRVIWERKCKRQSWERGERKRKRQLWTRGHPNASGKPESKGNVKKGKDKKTAGKLSVFRRSAKRALVVKKKWLDLNLAGWKTCEIRGS